jgi:hypothetical protein
LIIDSIIWVVMTTVQATGVANELLLHADQLGIADFDTQVTTGHHDGIGAEDDVFHRLVAGDGLGALDLGHDLGVGASFTGQFAGVAQIIAAAGEGDGQVVHVHAGGGLDVFLVLLGQGRGGGRHLLVDALVVGERAGHGDRGVDAGAFDLLDLQLHAPSSSSRMSPDPVPAGSCSRCRPAPGSLRLAEGGIENELVTDGQDRSCHP